MYLLFKNVVDVYFKILGSSSSGNSAILKVSDSTILIDAGMTGRKLETLLKNIGMNPENLDAVFLTHEHNDHSAGVRGLSKFQNLPIFANRDTIQALQPKLRKRPNWKILKPVIHSHLAPLKLIHLACLTMHMIQSDFTLNGVKTICSNLDQVWHG